MRGQGNLELAQETRKKERKNEKWPFFEHLVLACTMNLMNNLGLIRYIISWHLQISQSYLFRDIRVCVMHYIYGISVSSLYL